MDPPSVPCRSSRRTMIWHEAERSLTTDDGQPLDPEAAAAGVTYPFREVGVLRWGKDRNVCAPSGQADTEWRVCCELGAC